MKAAVQVVQRGGEVPSSTSLTAMIVFYSPSKAVVKGSRDLLLELWDPLQSSIYREWLKLETTNLARLMLITRGTNEKCKIGSKGAGRRS